MNSNQIKERRREVIVHLGLLEDFQRSKYSSYGWYLNSKGISVTHRNVYARLEKIQELGLVDKMNELRERMGVVFYE